MIRTIVIVGASLAGLRAAEALRADGYEERIVVIGAERHRPYDRPPLSKRLLSGDWEPDRIALRKVDELDGLGIDWKLGSAAIELDLDGRAVVLANGERVPFDGVILATGASPRRLPDQDAHAHVVVLRGLDDAVDLRARLASGSRRVVVIGAGFIGLEVAATARGLGNEVVVLEGAPAPLMRGLGAEMGAAVAEIHADHGVEIRTNVRVEGFAENAVLIDGGWHEPADVVVVGVGVAPNTGWLESSGLEVRDGVVCGPDLNAGAPLVYAAGDIVRWPHGLYGDELRIEHWTNAAEQGASAATNLLSEAAGQPTVPYESVPFFWSEQYDRRIQFLGRSTPADEVLIVAGSIADRKFTALYRAGEHLQGVVGVNMPRQVMPFRQLLQDRATWARAMEHVAASS